MFFMIKNHFKCILKQNVLFFFLPTHSHTGNVLHIFRQYDHNNRKIISNKIENDRIIDERC